MSHSFDLRSLSYFLAVAEELNFRRAAERLIISQPALSYQMAQLEKNLGLQLFERDHRGTSLTESGQALVEGARLLLQEANRLQRRLEQMAESGPQRLIVGVVDYIFFPRLPSALLELRNRFPGLKVETQDLGFPDQLEALLQGRIDLATVRFPQEHPELVIEPLVEGHWTLVLPRSHRLARKRSIELAALAGEPLILFSQRMHPPLFEWLLERCRDAGFEADVVYEISQLRLGPDLVAQGVGLWVGASYAFQDLPRGVVSRPLTGFDTRVALGLAWHRQSRSRPRQALIELLKDPGPGPH